MAIQKTRVGDIEIAHRWDGNPYGPVVMMAHAMGTSHRIWDLQVGALADRYHLLRYDWRGHGDTDAPEGPSRNSSRTQLERWTLWAWPRFIGWESPPAE
jgi:pimeloyl-ACP methyl ester carboxylesterase